MINEEQHVFSYNLGLIALKTMLLLILIQSCRNHDKLEEFWLQQK